MTSRAADVWIRAVGGELFSAGAIIMLRCRDSEAEAVLAGGACLRLAGLGCPPEYHHQLLAELARARRIYDVRWIVILSPKLTADSCRWTCSATDERSTSGALDVT